ncbi:Npun_F0296 family exosortase-dependent surface protein [Prochlorothrix hollandica]|uniref:Npun_F0296 family exosortase-dependent surface protein n=1 Tax=Prochlorothrix hollandica TaxID=1223 RepID=UPI0033418734
MHFSTPTSFSLSRLMGVAATAVATLALAPSAQAGTLGTIDFSLSEGCPTASCVSLQNAGYTVAGGAVLDPAKAKKNRYEIPGTNFGDKSNVHSYSVTSKKDDPTGASNPIIVSGLTGLFEMYWGSIDTYNVMEFFDGATSVGTISGYTLAGTTDWANITGIAQNGYNSAGNYGKDLFASFSGTFDSVKLLNKAQLPSVTQLPNGDKFKETEIAFEVAAKDVPEPTGVVGLLALGALGLATRKRIAQA